MTQRVQDLDYDADDFEVLLDDARMNAANDWEETFVGDMTERFKQYGRRMLISEAQLSHLERIAGDE